MHWNPVLLVLLNVYSYILIIITFTCARTQQSRILNFFTVVFKLCFLAYTNYTGCTKKNVVCLIFPHFKECCNRLFRGILYKNKLIIAENEEYWNREVVLRTSIVSCHGLGHF